MVKSIIEQDIEKHIQTISIKGVGSHVRILYEYHAKEIIQKALKELNKERYCTQCGSNDKHSISCNSITRGYVYDEKDVEKCFEVK